jgi:poly-gamma-glutamate synthesis protein (capsule biosynthesis protein)
MNNTNIRFIRILSAAILLSLCLSSCGIETRESSVTLPVGGAPGENDDGTEQTAGETEEAEAEEGKVTFLAAGDNIIHECVYLDAAETAESKGESGYDFDDMYESLADTVSSADIAFINQEGPVCSDYAPSGYPNFNAPDEIGGALSGVGFDIVNIANNHMLDMDGDSKGGGLKKSIEFWKTVDGVTLLGGYESEEDYDSLRYVEKNGIRIALLSYTYGTNGSISAGSGGCVVPVISDSDIVRQAAKARETADFVIAYVHWGTESTISSANMSYDEIVAAGYNTAFSPTDEQRRVASLLAENGVDVILGGHSHTLQPVEWIENDDRRTLVSYSLGNFLSTQLTVQNLVGAMLTFDIVRGDGGTVTAENPKIIPTVCHYSTDASRTDSLGLALRYGVKMYRLSDYGSELAAAHGAQSYGKFTVDDLWSYVYGAIDGEFISK